MLFTSPTPTETAYVSLGSNLGDQVATLASACEAIGALPGVELLAASPVYRTEPQGLRDQPYFLNQAVCLATSLGPMALLDALLGLEDAHGRVRGVRFGPRVLDLDLLLFGNTCMDNKRLTLPHPRMLDRAFVLVPLADLAPRLVLPQGVTVRAALGRIVHRVAGGNIYQPG